MWTAWPSFIISKRMELWCSQSIYFERNCISICCFVSVFFLLWQLAVAQFSRLNLDCIIKSIDLTLEHRNGSRRKSAKRKRENSTSRVNCIKWEKLQRLNLISSAAYCQPYEANQMASYQSCTQRIKFCRTVKILWLMTWFRQIFYQ